MTTKGATSTTAEPDYNSPAFVQARYDDNMSNSRFDAAVRNAGQLVRHFGKDSTKRSTWVDNFLRAVVRANGRIEAATLRTEFSRFWEDPIFRAPESLIDAGKRLTKIIDRIPSAIRPYVGQFLLQGLAEVRATGTSTPKISEAKIHLQSLHRSGVQITDHTTKLSARFTDREILITQYRNAPACSVRLITQVDSAKPYVILEQYGKFLSPKLAHPIFTKHWPRNVPIKTAEIREAFILTLGFSIEDTPAEVALLMNPTLPGGYFVPSTVEYMGNLTGYVVPNWSAVADEFVRRGGVKLKSDLK